MSFEGEFRHTIDAKGRLIVPARLRDNFQNDRVVLTRWLDGCLAMWSESRWAEIEERLSQQSTGRAQVRKLKRSIGAAKVTEDIDRQGRVGIPPKLRDLAGISREVVVIGAIDHGEIWSPEKWAVMEADVDDARLVELAQDVEF